MQGWAIQKVDVNASFQWSVNCHKILKENLPFLCRAPVVCVKIHLAGLHNLFISALVAVLMHTFSF